MPKFSSQGDLPPDRARRLVAESGFVVYEGGNNLFDEPLLVYAARPGVDWPDFDVFDHVGQPLAVARRDQHNPTIRKRNHNVYYDQQGNEILRIRPQSRLHNITFHLTGFTDGEATSGSSTIGDLTIKTNRMRCGEIAGPRFRGLAGASLVIFDDRKNQVGEIRAIKEGTFFSGMTHYVMSLKPGIRSELRRLLVGAPTMITILTNQRLVQPLE